jgi:hypothetical protein
VAKQWLRENEEQYVEVRDKVRDFLGMNPSVNGVQVEEMAESDE